MTARRPARTDEVPEADALKQAMPASAEDAVVDDDERAVDAVPDVVVPSEVPEADALEQAMPAGAGSPDDEWPDEDR